jgi:hypothetical protein
MLILSKKYKFKEKMWLYTGPAAWHFITLPKKIAKEIEDLFGINQKSFGSIRVKVTIGKTTWLTSIFKDTKAKSYLLPVKAEIRKKEKTKAGDLVSVMIEIN